MEIRDLSISYPFCKKKKREGNIILRIPGLHFVWTNRSERKKTLKAHKLQGHFIRSRARWIEQKKILNEDFMSSVLQCGLLPEQFKIKEDINSGTQ